ncbi:MAG: gamma-glutamyltransferase, partial [Acetobacteraceae bacterium]|nr:gamma-glutamyltransferase [Acetobacteraceae bacterium]
MLSRGGDAADAAVAIGFALGVTLPSRAGLGGGGACLAYNPASDSVNKGLPEAVLFLPGATSGAGGDRPAAIPMVARGLFALHARYGRRPFETLISPAEQLARFGVPASRALVRDFQVVAAPLLQDPSARQVFAPNG